MKNNPCATAILILMLSACTPLTMQPQPATESGAESSQSMVAATTSVIPQTISGALVLGSADAPVTLLLFTNYDCAYCSDFERDLMPRLQGEFIDTGMLRIMIVTVPLQKYPESDRNAHTLICGVKAGSGADVHRFLFADRTNFPALKTCLEDDAYLQSVMAKQYEVIRSLDVTLVPTYFINNTRFTGLPEYADLRGQILEKL